MLKRKGECAQHISAAHMLLKSTLWRCFRAKSALAARRIKTTVMEISRGQKIKFPKGSLHHEGGWWAHPREMLLLYGELFISFCILRDDLHFFPCSHTQYHTLLAIAAAASASSLSGPPRCLNINTPWAKYAGRTRAALTFMAKHTRTLHSDSIA